MELIVNRMEFSLSILL